MYGNLGYQPRAGAALAYLEQFPLNQMPEQHRSNLIYFHDNMNQGENQ